MPSLRAEPQADLPGDEPLSRGSLHRQHPGYGSVGRPPGETRRPPDKQEPLSLADLVAYPPAHFPIQQIPARVDRIDDEEVIFDLNHPLAGQSLTFSIEVVGISETATQQHGGCGCDCSGGEEGCGDSGCC